ncbi:MAG: hypothetical protein V3U13_01870 [Gemmatimonadota bacterium]
MSTTMLKKVTGVMWRARRLLLGAAVLALVAGCDDGPTGPGAGAQTVSLSIRLAGGSANPAPSLFAAGLMLTDGLGNTLEITSAEMVIRELEFERVETNGCDSELDDDGCEKFEVGPFILPLPLDGSVSTEIVASVEPGSYDEIEFDIHKPEDDDLADFAFIDANPNFADVSIRVTGTYNGQSFLFTSDLNAEQEIELTSPLEVGADPVGVTLTIDLDIWFRTLSGTLLDPRTANKGEPNENLVKDTIKASIDGFRDDDHDGVPHEDDFDEHDDGGDS